MKYKWKVSDEPTGRYRSFQNRGWPGAHYLNKEESPAAQIYCNTEGGVVDYRPYLVREGSHPPLTLHVADHSHKPHWKWRKAKGTFTTLKEAKEAFAAILKAHPEIAPKTEP